MATADEQVELCSITQGGQMRIKLVLVALMLTGMSGVSWAETAGEMLSNCRAIAEAKIKDGVIVYSPTLETQVCWGVFAFVQGVGRMVDERSKPLLPYCLPKGSRRAQHVAVFVEYAKKNPKRWHEDFDLVLVESLANAYPCK